MAAERSSHEPQSLGWFPVAMTVLVGSLRLLPHLLPIPYPWHAAPISAMSLYGGARLRWWQALSLPLLLMVSTDLLIWLLTGWKPFDLWVYGSILASVLLGRLLARTNSPWRVGGLAALASIQFFLVTNFGVWLASSVDPAEIPARAAMMRVTAGSQYPTGDVKYAANASGLGACYLMAVKPSPEQGAPYGFALPLFVSDMVFTGVLFGLHALASRRASRSVAARASLGGAS
jgi:hypothetical protein